MVHSLVEHQEQKIRIKQAISQLSKLISLWWHQFCWLNRWKLSWSNSSKCFVGVSFSARLRFCCWLCFATTGDTLHIDSTGSVHSINRCPLSIDVVPTAAFDVIDAIESSRVLTDSLREPDSIRWTTRRRSTHRDWTINLAIKQRSRQSDDTFVKATVACGHNYRRCRAIPDWVMRYILSDSLWQSES